MTSPSHPPQFNVERSLLAKAVAFAFVTGHGLAFAQTEASSEKPATSLEAVTVKGKAPVTLDATESAPSQGSVEARSSQSVVSNNFIRNYISPVADYTQALTTTPGAYAFSPNGVGLGDSKVTIRGLSDSNIVMSFDGIPFNDTNGVSHHSWVFFPSPFLGGAVVDRSPGSAATIGQATYGGSIDLKSRVLDQDPSTSVTASMGSWNTHLFGLEHQTGAFGTEGKSSLLLNVHEMKSDGYQNYNNQDRKAMSAKYQYAMDAQTTFTLFGSHLNLTSNTPNVKGTTRLNYDAGNFTALLTGDPKRPDYFGYNFYDVTTNFFYAGVETRFDNGWKLEDKLYRYSYYNKQNYNGTTISATSAVDKLNSYTTMGNLLRLSKDMGPGVFRTGVWYDRASSYRYQIPSDPRTWLDVSAPNFSETYVTTTVQPYAEYQYNVNDRLRVTPGIKYAGYRQDFVHLQDNGGAVGTLGGVLNASKTAITGGAASLSQGVSYKDWLPSLDVHYRIDPAWTVYGQYAVGDQIPSTSVFDVKNAQVSPVPKATKATTMQVGTVINRRDYTFAAAIWHSKLDGAYTALPADSFGNVAYALSGTLINQGIEAEANYRLGQGFSVYVNGTLGTFKTSGGQWIAGAPRDTETLALNYQQGPWASSWSLNRIGRQYNDAKDGTHEAFTLDPILLSNLFVNYRFRMPGSFLKQAKIQFAVNNLFNSHALTSVATPATGSSSATPSAADILTFLPGRSAALTATLSF